MVSRNLRIELSEKTTARQVADTQCGKTRRAFSRAKREEAQALSILEREEKAVLGIPEELHPASLFEARERHAETLLRLDETRAEHVDAKSAHREATTALASVNARIEQELSPRSHDVTVAFASA